MSFNPDLNKQTQEVIFCRKLSKPSHPSHQTISSNVHQLFVLIGKNT